MGYVNTVMMKKQYLMYLLNVGSMNKKEEKMIEELRKNRIQELNFKVLIKWSSEVNSKAFYDFIKETGLINRI